MHAISRPRFRCCSVLGLVEGALEWCEDRAEFVSELLDDFAALRELGKPPVGDGPAWQNEWFAEHQLKIWEVILRLDKDLTINLLISFKRDAILWHSTAGAVPSVVDADEDAEHVRLEIKSIDPPPLL